MSAEIKGLQNLARISRIHDRLLQEAVKQLMADILLEIVRLTNKGINARNQSFIPYSKATIIHKAKKGLSTIPNMQETSSMLHSLQVTPLSRTTALKKYKIGVTGSDINGVSNSAKLGSLRNRKNYVILEWSEHYKKMVERHMQRFIKRFIKTVSR